MTPTAERKLLTQIFDNQTTLVKANFENGTFIESDIRNLELVDGGTVNDEIANWYLISIEKACIAEARGYMVLINEFGAWLGVELGCQLFQITPEFHDLFAE